MSVESARAFCMRLMADDEFRDSLGKAASPEAIAEIMKKENYDFSQHDLLKNLLLRFIKRGQRLLQIDVLPLQGVIQCIKPNLIQVVDPRCNRLFLSAFYDLFRIHITYQLMVSLSFFDRLSVLLTNAPSASCVSSSRLR